MRFLPSCTFFLLFIAGSALGKPLFPKIYKIVNKCPTSIDLYMNDRADGSLAPGASKNRSVMETAWFSTTANGGVVDYSTRAAFYDNVAEGKYWYTIIKNVDNFNVGVSIVPNNHPDTNGFCAPIACNTLDCTAASTTRAITFPHDDGSNTAPGAPTFRCTFPDVTYTITFCPTGAFPTQTQIGRPIWPGGVKTKCLDVKGAVYANGTPVQIYDCNGTGAQRWVMKRGSTKVQVAGKNFCLDAGSVPASGVGMKIWQCRDNHPPQQWVYTENLNRIELQGKGQCLDFTKGSLDNGNRAQTWKCGNKSPNQVWSAEIPSLTRLPDRVRLRSNDL